MNFDDTPSEAAFRAKARAWLEENGPSPEESFLMSHPAPDKAQAIALAKRWQAKRADAGWAYPQWPKEYGGMDATPIQHEIWVQELLRYTSPPGMGLINFFDVGFSVCAPSIIPFGTEEQKRRYLPPLLRGDEIWCQLFSEPGIGSDLAGVIVRAERDGDDWIVNGTKRWTSLAHIADNGLLVVRTDENVPKHKGMTTFMVPMNAPGITITPIKQISGMSGFNEVVFDNVRIPDSQRLGAVGDGWKVVLTSLSSERLAVGDIRPDNFDELLFDLASELEIDDRPALSHDDVRQKLADSYVTARGLKYTKYRLLTDLSRGRSPGPEASITKLVSASYLQNSSTFGMDLMEQAGILSEPGDVPHSMLFWKSFFVSMGFRIASGTDEVLRNVIAERVLGLPADIKVDKDPPFREVPRSD